MKVNKHDDVEFFIQGLYVGWTILKWIVINEIVLQVQTPGNAKLKKNTLLYKRILSLLYLKNSLGLRRGVVLA